MFQDSELPFQIERRIFTKNLVFGLVHNLTLFLSSLEYYILLYLGSKLEYASVVWYYTVYWSQ
jgi:hypothetical protein